MTAISPLERVRARAEALSVLGVGPHASRDDIRTAWRKLAFESHPDRNGEGDLDFEQIRSAYEFLQGGAGDSFLKPIERPGAAPTTTSRAIPKPVLEKRTFDLSADVIAACRDALTSDEAEPATMGAANKPSHNEASGSSPGSDKSKRAHVAASVSRLGRKLTFCVDAPLRKGMNKIALPTNVLTGKQKPDPRVVSFFSHDSGGGVVSLPDGVVRSLFPGARSVRIRFLGGGIERPVTEIKEGKGAVA